MFLIFDLVINFIESVIVTWLSTGYLLFSSRKKKWTSFLLLSVLLFLEVTILNSLMVYESVYLFVYISTIFVVDSLFSENDVAEVMMISILSLTLVAVCNSAALFSAGIIFSKSITQVMNSELVFSFAIVISKVFFAVAVLFVIRYLSRVHIVKNDYFRNFLVIIFCAHCCFMYYEHIVFSVAHSKYGAFGSMILLSVIVITAFYQFYEIQKEAMDTISKVIIEKEIKYLKMQYDNIEEKNTEIRAIKHDLNNILVLISGHLSNGNITRAQEIVSSQIKEVSKVNSFASTGIPEIDIIVNAKKAKAAEAGINFLCKIALKDTIKIDCLELCILLANAIDNAFENVHPSKKIVELVIIQEEDKLYIKVTNSVSKNVMLDNPNLISSKEDKINHGYGLKNIQTIIKKYKGNIHFECTDDIFTMLILI